MNSLVFNEISINPTPLATFFKVFVGAECFWKEAKTDDFSLSVMMSFIETGLSLLDREDTLDIKQSIRMKDPQETYTIFHE